MTGFMFINSLFVLYCTHQLNMSTEQSYQLYAAYISLIFGLPILGGFLGDRFLGHNFSIIYSHLLVIAGLFIFAIETYFTFYLGLAIYVIGTATMVPNLYVLLGRLYDKQDPHRGSGFTIAYIGMNVGAFISAFLSGYIVSAWGYAPAFVAGGVMSIFSLIIFLMNKHLYGHADQANEVRSKKQVLMGISISLLSIPVIAELIEHAKLSNALLIAVGVLAILFVLKIALKESDKAKRNKYFVFLALTLISVSFWALYMLAPTALTIFIERNVDRHLFTWLIPTSSVLSLNPFFIITFGSFLSFFWIYLSKRDQNPSIPAKFSMGVIMMGLGYLVLVLGIQFANPAGMVAFVWIVLSYFLQTAGELFLAPIGNSMVGSLVAHKYESFMLGIWQLGTGVAGALSSFLAVDTSAAKGIVAPLQTNPVFAHAFNYFGLSTLIIGILIIMVVPKMRRIIRH